MRFVVDSVVLEVLGGSDVLGCRVQLRSVSGKIAVSWGMLGERDLLGVGEAVISGSEDALWLYLWLLMALLCEVLVVLGGRDW